MTQHTDTPAPTKRPRAQHQVKLEPIYVDLTAIPDLVTLSAPTWQRLVRQGEAPAARKLSGGRVAWLLSEVRAWCESRPVSDLLPPVNAGRRVTLGEGK